MKRFSRLVLLASVCLLLFSVADAGAQSGPLSFSSSTQLLWGDDLLADNQVIVAQYLRFGLNPEGKKYSLSGYGRLWTALNDGSVRDNDFNTRLYYLFMDFNPTDTVSVRVGRQFTAFTAGTSVMDGIRADVHKIGPVGVTVAAGRDVIYSLDSEFTRGGNYFAGIDLHLENVKATQLGVSYVRKYNEGDLAREELGLNARRFYRYFSPYAELRYDLLSRTFDDALAGFDIFPMSNLKIKAEFYHMYPTFDTTSIYSVFAVDKFREYLLRAEYNLDAPVTVYAQYSRQTYDEDPGADVYTVGAMANPTDKLTVNASVDYRKGYSGYNGSTGNSDGKLFGFQVYGDYRLRKELLISAGVQYDAFNRPEDITGEHSAQRYWIGGKWIATKNVSFSARFEDNANPNFKHRTLGRLTMDWNL